MDHLEALRARAEYKRSMQMIAGLSAFVQGTSSTPPETDCDAASTSAPSTLTTPSGPATPGWEAGALPEASTFFQPSDTAVTCPQSELVGEEITSLEETVNSRRSGKTTRDMVADARGICTLLAAAYANDVPINHWPIAQRTLRALCRRYPRGKIWCFNDDEESSSSAETSPELSTSPHKESAANVSRKSKRQLRRQKQHAELEKLIPGVQCLALMLVRDNADGTWGAGAVLYTFSPQRTFSQKGEFNFMAAFSDVLITELARTETKATLRAKSEFMSSLSHELRTPLHGILATVEQLYEETDPYVAAKVVSQVELCGRTLLDVIDHLLDFSEVSNDDHSHCCC